MKNWGYARCSTNESKQDITRQINALKVAGADDVIFEYEHGDAKVKEQLQTMLEAAQAGDTIITLEVSRLSRSTQQLCEIVEIIKQKRLRLIIVGSITVDCRSGEIDPMSQAFGFPHLSELLALSFYFRRACVLRCGYIVSWKNSEPVIKT